MIRTLSSIFVGITAIILIAMGGSFGCSSDNAEEMLSPPTIITITAGDGQVTLSWEAVTGAERYNIYWKDAPGVTKGDNPIENVTSPYVHTGLTDGQIYYYALTAANASGESALSAELSAQPGSTSPDAPSNPSATSGYEQVTVSWDTVPGATSYNLYWSTTAGVTQENGTLIEDVTSPYAHTDLTPMTMYYYVVTATIGGMESPDSQEVSATALYPLLRAFATSATGTGDLSSWPEAQGETGLQAADTICQTLADNEGLKGTFRAWLSDDFDDAYCRIHNLSGKLSSFCGQSTKPISAGPWVRMDGVPFGDTITKMLNPDLMVYAPVTFDERSGRVNVTELLYTQTNADGEDTTSFPCNNWTNSAAAGNVTLGSVASTGRRWTDEAELAACGGDFHLLCMQTNTGAPLPDFVKTGRRVFVTSASGNGNLGSWPDAGSSTGLAAGDAICQKLASDAGLENAANFKAWLSGSLLPVKDRITGNGPWVRLDGVRIANSRTDLLDGSLLAPINLTETLDYVDEEVWTGSNISGVWSGNSCSDWGNETPSASGSMGLAAGSISHWTSYATRKCNETLRLYCFEE